MHHLYLQSESTECGLICLAYSAAKLGAELDPVELRRRFPVSSRGLNLKQISDIAASMDMLARAVRCEPEELTLLKRPAILHWSLRHFVVLDEVRKDHIVVHDPARGRRIIPWVDVIKSFSGVALELSAAPAFKPRRERSPLSVWSWIRLTPELYGGLGQTLLLSVVLQAYVIASPFYIRLAIDEGANKGDLELLTVLAIGFGLFGLFNMGATVLRNFAMQHVSAHMTWDMSLRLFRHLIRLPLEWFQRRKLADTISRLDSINPIRDLVSGSLISSLVDGLLALTTLCMMFVYAWPLAILVCTGIVLYTGIKLGTLPRSLRLSAENLTAQIAENGKRIETVKAIQTIKVMAAETHQELQWSNKFASVVRRRLITGNFQASINAAHQGLEMAVTTLIIFLAARDVVQGKMTVGLLYAFMAYRQQFVDAITNVIDQLIQWRLSDVYSFRLADIVLTPKEKGIDLVETLPVEIKGEVELVELGFRYSIFDPFVFKGLHLKVSAGDFIAIVGPSGAGKSTLLKVMCGLYPATMGEVRIDGIPISSWGTKTLRQSYGVVMQDDELLSGSIADNVSFFDDTVDMDRVWLALEAAALKDDVMKMPMKAETFVGDMGGSLSGGQRQRVLIARALYKQPKILFFDEATSHLDMKTEEIINQSLRKLKISRIVIAHRRETIAAADMIFDIMRGKILHRRPDVANHPMEQAMVMTSST